MPSKGSLVSDCIETPSQTFLLTSQVDDSRLPNYCDWTARDGKYVIDFGGDGEVEK